MYESRAECKGSHSAGQALMQCTRCRSDVVIAISQGQEAADTGRAGRAHFSLQCYDATFFAHYCHRFHDALLVHTHHLSKQCVQLLYSVCVIWNQRLQCCPMQADPTNVRAATRAATCHLKMGQLTEASQMLDSVAGTVRASGKALPPELVSKQDDLDVTKRLISEVPLRPTFAGGLANGSATTLCVQIAWLTLHACTALSADLKLGHLLYNSLQLAWLALQFYVS